MSLPRAGGEGFEEVEELGEGVFAVGQLEGAVAEAALDRKSVV